MKSSCSRPFDLKRRRAGAVVLALALAGCQIEDRGGVSLRVPVESPSSTRTRIIWLVGSMSGPDSWRGDDAFAGADLAVQVLNRNLKENQPRYELITRDDGGDPARATELVQEVAPSGQTVGVVYAGPPEGLPPAEPALAASGVPAILCYGDLYGARLLSPHVFQASPSFLWEARRITDYVLRDREYTRVGLLSDRSLDGRTARRSLILALQEEGARLTASPTFGREIRNPRAAWTALRRRRVQAVVLQASPPSAARLLSELEEMGASYRGTAAARASASKGSRWAPHVIGLDLVMTPSLIWSVLSPGTVAADTYARGAHYLPIPNLERFRARFNDWWDAEPLGWEQRAYDAARMIGWAVRRAGTEVDLARQLEKMRRLRFGGLDITFGPDDHTSVEQSTVGLWVVPRPAARVPEASRIPDELPWVPLARGFSIDGQRTDVLPQDWKWLFRNAPPPRGPAPRFSRSLFGVTTTESDPIH